MPGANVLGARCRALQHAHAGAPAPPRRLLVRQAVLVHYLVEGARALGEGRQVDDQLRVGVLRQELLLERLRLDGGQHAHERRDLADERVVVGHRAALHVLQHAQQCPHPAVEHLHRGVQRGVMCRQVVGAAGGAGWQDLGHLVHRDALRLRGLDGVRGRDEDHRGAAVDEVQLALIQRDGEVLCGGVDPWVEHQEDRALVRLHHQLMDLHVFVLQLRARGVPAHDIDRGEHLLVLVLLGREELLVQAHLAAVRVVLQLKRVADLHDAAGVGAQQAAQHPRRRVVHVGLGAREVVAHVDEHQRVQPELQPGAALLV
mmetsp:Transcript_40628/g.104021  ORF Transcript_40628/g.104021 Transcript_40628/m.104021 type:complete len:316 (+) Transcript_40628:150-1097(+)